MSNLKEKLEDRLENSYHFRDYEIMDSSDYGSINKVGVHYLIEEGDHIDSRIDDALHTFFRDGFGTIYFYVETKPETIQLKVV